MNYLGNFGTPSSLILAFEVPTWCKLCLIWDIQVFYCLFVQHWTCNMQIFHYSIYHSFTAVVMLNIFVNLLSCFFHDTHLAEILWNPGITPPSLDTHESVNRNSVLWSIPIYCYPQHAPTNCSEQTVVLLQSLYGKCISLACNILLIKGHWTP